MPEEDKGPRLGKDGSNGFHRVRMHAPFAPSFWLGGWSKIALVLMLLLGSFVVPGCGTEQGSGNVTSETRNVSDFTEVALNGTGNLVVRQTGSESLNIEAEDNVIPEIKTEVEGNRLTIETGNNMPIPTQPITYELTVKDLSDLELAGAGSIDASDINTDSLKVTTSGSGDVKAAGKTDSQDVEISGAGSYRAEDLESEEAEIDISGAGEAIVKVEDRLDVRISGYGSVEYIGNPTVSRDITGAGEVTRR
jgi:predicted small secreted protein